MAGSGSPQPNKPKAPGPAAQAPRKPLQVLHISRREEKERLKEKASSEEPNKKENNPNALSRPKASTEEAPIEPKSFSNASTSNFTTSAKPTTNSLGIDNLDGISMADLLGPANQTASNSTAKQTWDPRASRSVDDFDFDEDAFLAALDENEPIGTTGEIAKGSVIGIESDGVYVDIGGKAPGFMPKNECGLGVITNLKEKFPKGLEVEVLVTRDQNADGMVTISCRALALRKSWDKVRELEKEGQVVQVKVNGFNRGGVTCDLEGLRGFVPRSQLENGEAHETLVGKTLGVAFLEVNPETRKLVLSEKRATTAARFAQLEIGQLVEGKVSAVKPYGLFIELGGVSGLLHQSVITNGSLRSIREVFDLGDPVKALITQLDPGRGRIGLNTAMLEGPPGELLVDKSKVMAEAEDRANKARNVLRQKEQSAG